jgi:hypothetical protein
MIYKRQQKALHRKRTVFSFLTRDFEEFFSDHYHEAGQGGYDYCYLQRSGLSPLENARIRRTKRIRGIFPLTYPVNRLKLLHHGSRWQQLIWR